MFVLSLDFYKDLFFRPFPTCENHHFVCFASPPSSDSDWAGSGGNRRIDTRHCQSAHRRDRRTRRRRHSSSAWEVHRHVMESDGAGRPGAGRRDTRQNWVTKSDYPRRQSLKIKY